MDLFDLLGFAIPLLGVIYFFPAFLASAQNHPNTRAIYALPILCSWTVIGWAVAIIWAMTNADKRNATSP
jgi:4-amino-4-deoxy-L-arabinose transferase-like glycosyltransferase